ncbi:hypothetical protein MLD38_037479 [Melastoma candidum]|uniref:Uncharacterized protein n=1 Tax=Melastoma candidum TaxID=119954 RepID=A0ACB9LNL3_9MYRT|nr:hypothetical protein MLD38_037479 [Melastoma candidum]
MKVRVGSSSRWKNTLFIFGFRDKGVGSFRREERMVTVEEVEHVRAVHNGRDEEEVDEGKMGTTGEGLEWGLFGFGLGLMVETVILHSVAVAA